MRLAKQSQFIPLQNVVYFITLPSLVRKIFTFYINDVLILKMSISRAKGLNWFTPLCITSKKRLKRSSCPCAYHENVWVERRYISTY